MTGCRLLSLATAAMLLCLPTAAQAAEAPIWQRALRWISGDSSETKVPVTMVGRHVQISKPAAAQPSDAERAARIVGDARHVLQRYANVADAERDGYLAFAPRGHMGEEIHFVHVGHSQREASRPDWTQPGALLYKRTAHGLVAVGVMMTAPNEADANMLDARAPLSRAVWHRHVNFCGEPKGTPRTLLEGPNARFGFYGAIDTEVECNAAGGYWIPIAFGWMTHVYPLEGDPAKLWKHDHAKTSAPPGAPAHRH